MPKRGQSIVYETLERLDIPYEELDHDPVFTIEEMQRLDFPEDVEYAKNLFLRDAKGRRHFLVVIRKERKADLQELAEVIGCSRLSFASEDRLLRYLGITPGAVAPLAILNDEPRAVEVVIDSGFEGVRRFGVHPNDNSATVVLAFSDMLKIIEDHGNPIQFF